MLRCRRYFYAITSDVDADNAGKLLKVDTWSGDVITWQEENVYCSEPVFLPCPGSTEEDDGVLVSSIIWGKPDVSRFKNKKNIFIRRRQTLI